MTKKHFWTILTTLFFVLIFSFSACKSSKKASKSDTKNNTTTSSKVKETAAPKLEFITKTIDVPPVNMSFNNEATVKKVQVLLYLSGYTPGRIDGTLKEQTQTALKKYQEENNIPIGDLSQKTLNALGVPLMDFEVSDIQQQLNSKGYDAGSVDNLVGPMTRGAYTNFIQQHELPAIGMTKELKTALFSTEANFNNKDKTDDLFFQDLPDANKSSFTATNITRANASIANVKQALFAKGYDTGNMDNEITKRFEDALYRYQVDNNLPVGGLNASTMKALGFQ